MKRQAAEINSNYALDSISYKEQYLSIKLTVRNKVSSFNLNLQHVKKSESIILALILSLIFYYLFMYEESGIVKCSSFIMFYSMSKIYSSTS